jgi:hypothetical protein
MSKAKARGKRYETALRVGSLANLALVSARATRAIEDHRAVARSGPSRGRPRRAMDVDQFLAVTLATAFQAFQGEMAPIFNIVQAVLIPLLGILYLIQRFVDHGSSNNHRVLVLEVVGAIAVLEALAAGIRVFAGV